jgi:hypothetical protein
MGGTCTHHGDEKCILLFRKLGRLGVDRRIILKMGHKYIRWEGEEWI